ncbi:MAG: response regulator [Candidatus Pacebacteria bacterium]|nr:response regulator [Candidatus Paceibacterota bacterium]MBP9851612.1 response regulator [Candidatus Paceibacterota bacterium]
MAKTILVVEDDNFLSGLEAKKLKEKGYEVLTAANSDEAFKAIADAKGAVDLVLLDLMLPGVDGFEILKNIRKDEVIGKVPVIVFSNLYEEKDVKEANHLGISNFMVKSNFTLDELIEKIKMLIG